jgi:broad specificity phosphatase PhoE
MLRKKPYFAVTTTCICFLFFSGIIMTATSTSDSKTGSGSTLPKTVYLIRHAESEENRRVGSLKNMFRSVTAFSLPSFKDIGASFELLHVTGQVDSAVSDVGVQQIASMGAQLRESNFVETTGVTLVAHSPLERARQTSHGLLGCVANHRAAGASTSATASTTEDCKVDSVERVQELDILKEKYVSEWIPGNYDSFQARITQFEEWLQNQPEETVAVVGHSQYFKAMLGLDFKFGNCDVWQVQFDGNGSTTSSSDIIPLEKKNEVDIDGRTYTLPKPWSLLKKIYTCDVLSAKETTPTEE